MYKRLDLIYSGPVCDVYKGESDAGAPVALKVGDLDIIRKPHDFKNEIKIMKELHHANIVEFLDSYTLHDEHVLVMPLYDRNLTEVMRQFLRRMVRFDFSNPLATHMSSRNELPLASIRLIVWGLVDAIAYIHKQQIIHRDIKPSNVFFKTLDRLDTPILGDFGISYDFGSPPIDEPPTDKITDIATGYYKAPELCFAVSDYGCEVDLWSLGILISCLYSENGEPANRIVYEEETDQFPELNDFVLLQGTFEAFGTPTVADETSQLYWPRLTDPLFHFVDFKYVPRNRRPIDALLPRCNDPQIKELFDGLTRYDKREIVRPEAIQSNGNRDKVESGNGKKIARA